MTISPELFETYKNQPYFEGSAYSCEICHRRMAGGRHFLKRESIPEPIWICPDCWPAVIQQLGQFVEEEE